MRTSFLLCGAVTTALSLLTATGVVAQTTAVPQPAKQAASAAWAKSAKITAVIVPETDEAELLDLHMWRFVVTAPKPAHMVDFIVETQERGKLSHTLLSLSMDPNFAWPMNKRLTFFVGQYMPSGDHLEAIGKVKYQLRMSGYRPAPLTEYGGSTASDVVDNPFAGRQNWEVFSGPVQRPDGSFAMIAYSKDPNQSEKIMPDAALVFRVQEREQ